MSAQNNVRNTLRRAPFLKGFIANENPRNFARGPVFNFEMNNESQPDVQRQMRTLLSRLPNAPLPSNFTARVMQAVELEDLRRSRRSLFGWNWSWRALLPRTAAVAALAVFAAITFHSHELYIRQVAIAKNAALVASQPLPSVEALKNFEAIQRMGQPARADDDLLALASDMK
jgi:hypothetical protein